MRLVKTIVSHAIKSFSIIGKLFQKIVKRMLKWHSYLDSKDSNCSYIPQHTIILPCEVTQVG